MKKRLVYTDFLRIIAIFGVIMIHTTANILTATPVSQRAWQAANVLSGMVRFSVPVFFMVSGVFFLDPGKEVTFRRILTRYIPRLIAALLFWGIAYEMYFVLGDWIRTGDFPGYMALEGVLNVFRGKGHFHLYFIYIIIGLYLVTPILRVFIKGASRRMIEYFLLLFFVFTGAIPLITRFAPFSQFAPVANQILMRFVGGYVGYFIAGYYFNNFEFSKKTTWAIYVTGAVAAVGAIVATAHFSLMKGSTDVSLYEGLSPLMMLFAWAVFLVAKNLFANTRDRAADVIAMVSKTTFGIYLMHDFFNMLLRTLDIHLNNYPVYLAAPAYSAGVFIACMLISGVGLKVPLVNKWLL